MILVVDSTGKIKYMPLPMLTGTARRTRNPTAEGGTAATTSSSTGTNGSTSRLNAEGAAAPAASLSVSVNQPGSVDSATEPDGQSQSMPGLTSAASAEASGSANWDSKRVWLSRVAVWIDNYVAGSYASSHWTATLLGEVVMACSEDIIVCSTANATNVSVVCLAYA